VFLGSSIAVGGPIFVSTNWKTMKMLIDIVRKLVVVIAGNAFAKGRGAVDNGTTTYTFSSREKDNNKTGKGMLQPVSVKVK